MKREPAMNHRSENTPIACSLTTPEFRDREATILAEFRSGVMETDELQEGYVFRLPGDARWIRLVAELMVAERECCPFLAFEMSLVPHAGSMMVRVTGHAGTKEFMRNVFYMPDASGRISGSQ
jgi:hypothetical protein